MTDSKSRGSDGENDNPFEIQAFSGQTQFYVSIGLMGSTIPIAAALKYMELSIESRILGVAAIFIMAALAWTIEGAREKDDR